MLYPLDSNLKVDVQLELLAYERCIPRPWWNPFAPAHAIYFVECPSSKLQELQETSGDLNPLVYALGTGVTGIPVPALFHKEKGERHPDYPTLTPIEELTQQFVGSRVYEIAYRGRTLKKMVRAWKTHHPSDGEFETEKATYVAHVLDEILQRRGTTITPMYTVAMTTTPTGNVFWATLTYST
ncbi:hypothetical protein COY95_02995 [Candidatus Woesearchaeota archaeon CG_4_10_14_0_8_um_filter_47_5]|nr:MAG: hypothetical protein COY95_02995 [Candidatus Woesearchaeota archaeon CG_4_10_14_0_8_um_filter_47_5]